jgi:hypothetical protein
MILERENNSSNLKINKKYDATMLLNNFDSRAAIKSKTSGIQSFLPGSAVRNTLPGRKDWVILSSLPDFRLTCNNN